MARFRPAEILGALEEHRVRYVIIGGIAAAAVGVPIVTGDLDVTPASDRANLERLAAVLSRLEARLRASESPEGVPFPIDGAMLATAQTWTLTTRAGDLDIVFSPAGTGGYDDLRRDAQRLEIAGGLEVTVASLADVIRSKEAAARAKDLAQLPLLRRTLERIRERSRPRLGR